MKINVNIYLFYISFCRCTSSANTDEDVNSFEGSIFLIIVYLSNNFPHTMHLNWCVFKCILSVGASLNYLSQFSHKNKSSVKWNLMVSEFTWIIESFVTVLTINFNCDKCDKWFNVSGKLRHHKVSVHGGLTFVWELWEII